MRITVGRRGEDYSTIQEAINAVPYDVEAEIVVSEGEYREKLFSDKRHLTIRGEGNVRIICSDFAYKKDAAGRKLGTFRSYTAFFSGEYIALADLTIVNDAGRGEDVGQAVALYLDASEARCSSITLLSHQDTLFIAPLPAAEREKGGFYGPRYLSPRKPCRAVFSSCEIAGSIDFIFGGGDALFEDCIIRSTEPGYVAAPSGRKDGTGFVFLRSAFVSDGLPDESVFLMRPWRPEGKASFLDCSFSGHIDRRYRSSWNGEADESTFVLSSCTRAGQPVPDTPSFDPSLLPSFR